MLDRYFRVLRRLEQTIFTFFFYSPSFLRLLSYLKKEVQYGDSPVGGDTKASDVLTGI
jgi:hypothetical protein